MNVGFPTIVSTAVDFLPDLHSGGSLNKLRRHIEDEKLRRYLAESVIGRTRNFKSPYGG